MGARASVLAEEDLDIITNSTGFTPHEIKRLFKRFKRLDKDSTGSITTEEFLSIPELSMNPLVSRVLAIFDSGHTDNVNFQRFAEVLSVFRPMSGSTETRDEQCRKKIEYAFKIYDVDEDGYISQQDLLTVLRLMVGTNISEENLLSIADKTIAEADTEDNDGRISFAEFQSVLMRNNTDMDAKLSIRF